MQVIQHATGQQHQRQDEKTKHDTAVNVTPTPIVVGYFAKRARFAMVRRGRFFVLVRAGCTGHAGRGFGIGGLTNGTRFTGRFAARFIVVRTGLT